MRPESLGNYAGTGGLRLGDFIEAKMGEDGTDFAKLPTMLIVRRGLSKAKH